MDLGLFYSKIKRGKLLEHKISWKILKINVEDDIEMIKMINLLIKMIHFEDDIGLTLIFSWQDQICFQDFHMGRVFGTCIRFRCKS